MVKYFEKVKVLKNIDRGYDGHVLMKVLKSGFDKNLECFLAHQEKINFVEGKIVHVQLRLMDFAKKTKLNVSIKKIEQSKHSENSVNRTAIFGQIVNSKPHEKFQDYREIILDCGVFVKTRAKNDDDFKIGDFVKIEGRLDVIFVSKTYN